MSAELMPTSFLAIAGLDATAAAARLRAGAAAWPHEGDTTAEFSDPHGQIHLRAAATLADHLAGGPFLVDAARATCADGYAFVGGPTPSRLAGPADVRLAIDADPAGTAKSPLDGPLAFVDASADGLRAAAGFLGVPNVFWAQIAAPGGGAAVVVGNRALAVAMAAAPPGRTPALDPLVLSSLFSAARVPFGDATAFAGVRMLAVDALLTFRDGRLQIRQRPATAPRPFDADAEAAALRARAEALGAVALPCRIALTGGKDSRLVLAAAMGSGLRARIDGAYLKGDDGMADVAVGRRLAALVGLPFHLEPSPLPAMALSAVDRHLALTGAMLGAWDLKAHVEVPARAGLHGGFGEIYKSHARWFSWLPEAGGLGWAAARAFYLRPGWIDAFGLLRPAARAQISDTYADWLTRCRGEGQPLADLHDRWHRECRMRRWLGTSLQAGGAVAPMLNPLGSAALLGAYLGLPLRDRVDQRVHFELMRRLAPELACQPFANARWHRRWRSVLGVDPAPVTGGAVAAQRRFFARHQEAIAVEIGARRDDGFADVVRPDVAAHWLQRARASGLAGSHRPVEIALALFTLRRALAGPMVPVRVALVSR